MKTKQKAANDFCLHLLNEICNKLINVRLICINLEAIGDLLHQLHTLQSTTLVLHI